MFYGHQRSHKSTVDVSHLWAIIRDNRISVLTAEQCNSGQNAGSAGQMLHNDNNDDDNNNNNAAFIGIGIFAIVAVVAAAATAALLIRRRRIIRERLVAHPTSIFNLRPSCPCHPIPKCVRSITNLDCTDDIKRKTSEAKFHIRVAVQT